MEIKILLFVTIVFSSSLMATTSGAFDASTAFLIKVDQSGNGDFKKIQDAINVVPSNNSDNVFISIKPGTYREKVMVNKPFITLSGSEASTTIITGSAYDNIVESATLSVISPNFVARSLTIQNAFGVGKKAVALRVSADKAAFYGCRILSFQDTLFDDIGRHYYSNSYIEGGIDFIFGKAATLFEKCHIHSVTTLTGAITAHRRESPSENTGFTFSGCSITGVGKKCMLGRPWGPYSRVVFAMTSMPSCIQPQGWDDWGRPASHSTVYYGEYKCYGPGATTSGRVKWSKVLSDAEVKPFLSMDMIGGRDWLRPKPTNFKKPSYLSPKSKNR